MYECSMSCFLMYQLTERGSVYPPQLSFLPTFIVATQRQWPPTSPSQVREIMVFLAVDARPDMSVD